MTGDEKREIARLEHLGDHYRTWDETLRLKMLYRKRHMETFEEPAASDATGSK